MAEAKKSQINNKVILKNSLFLYVRMVLLAVINFFAVRIVLQSLGVEDYGIYNVVGGIVTMFSFLNSSLTTASQRYFSIEIAIGDPMGLNRVFCLNATVFGLLTIGIIIIAETLGLWFLNNEMTIPADRLFAANVVYQFSIIAFLFNMLSTPYNAMIVAHERMKAFAWIGLAEGAGRLLIAFAIMLSDFDRLIFYGALMMFLSLIVMLSYRWFCIKSFGNAARLKLIKDWKGVKDIFSFCGWHFWGTFSMVIRGNGINILINMFFNPVVNAARAIGYQIESVVSQLANNYFTAVKPQIYKAYSAGERTELFKLINRSTILSMLLISIFLYPICINTEFILSIWLDEVPQGAALFARLALLNCLIEATGNPTIAPALAYGNIKRFEIVTSSIILLNLPFSYLILKLGASAEMTVVISIIISIISVFVRAAFLKQMMGFTIRNYLILFGKILMLSGAIYLIVHYVGEAIDDKIIKFFVSSTISVILVISGYIHCVLDKGDKEIIISLIKKKIFKCH